MIRFIEITNKNIWEICKLSVFDNQKDFVAENIQSLAEAYATRNEGNIAQPYGVYNDNNLIGFVMIGYGTVGNEEEIDLIKHNYCLWRLMIDEKYQHQGFAKQILDKVLDFVRSYPYGPADYIWLSYEPENIHAKKVYEKYGFKETNDYCGNEIIAVLKL